MKFNVRIGESALSKLTFDRLCRIADKIGPDALKTLAKIHEYRTEEHNENLS